MERLHGSDLSVYRQTPNVEGARDRLSELPAVMSAVCRRTPRTDYVSQAKHPSTTEMGSTGAYGRFCFALSAVMALSTRRRRVSSDFASSMGTMKPFF